MSHKQLGVRQILDGAAECAHLGLELASQRQRLDVEHRQKVVLRAHLGLELAAQGHRLSRTRR